jgi:hypothetical protein
VTSFRVYKVDRGIPASMGSIEATASDDDFVHRFRAVMPKPGEDYATFILRPLDANGQETGSEFTHIVNPHHTALETLRRAEAAGGGVGGSGGGGGVQYLPAAAPAADSALIGMLKDVLGAVIDGKRTAATLEADERQRKLEGDQSREQMIAAGLAGAYEQVLNRQAAQAEGFAQYQQMQTNQMTQQQAAMFQGILQQAEQAAAAAERRAREDREAAEQRHRQDMERERARLEGLRQEAAAAEREREERRERERRLEREEREERKAVEAKRLEAERAEAERKVQREIEDLKARDRERQREHEAKIKQMEIDAAERRAEAERRAAAEAAHAERLASLELIKAEQLSRSSPAAGLDNVVKPLAQVLSLFGLDPAEALQRVVGGGGEEPGPSAALEVVKVMGPVLGQTIQAYFAAKAPQALPNREQRRGRAVQPRRGRGGPARGAPRGYAQPVDDEDDDDEDVDDDDSAYEGDDEDDERQPPPAFQAAPAQRQVNAPPMPTAPGQVPQAGGVVTLPGGAQPQPVVQTPLQGAPLAMPGPQGVDAGALTMTLQEQGIAREAATGLVDALIDADPETWEGLVINAIIQQPLIGKLIARDSLRAVVIGAGGDVALLNKLIARLRANPLTPTDLHYGV